jgi:hypothetical protein
VLIVSSHRYRFPGRDYYQPQRGLFTPVKGGSGTVIHANDEENIIYNVYNEPRAEGERSIVTSLSSFALSDSSHFICSFPPD